MTKEQVEKHKEVLKWFMNNPNKGVWYKNSLGGWHLTCNPPFNVESVHIQNDEYADFRRALADGKTLEYTDDKGKTWFTHCDKLDTWYMPKHIRIKNDKPKLKVGDWVHTNNTLGQIKKSVSGKLYTTIPNKYGSLIIPLDKLDNIKKWEPKNGELCVFWDNKDDIYIIAKYTKSKEVNGITGGELDNIAPLDFIQSLKDI